MTFIVVYVLGLALCLSAGVHIISMLNKQSKEFLYADLGMAPGLLPALGGFLVFPFMNGIVGVAVWWYLLTHPPVWGKRTGGVDPADVRKACANPKCPGYTVNVTSYCRDACKWNHDDDKAHEAYLLEHNQPKTARSKNGD